MNAKNIQHLNRIQIACAFKAADGIIAACAYNKQNNIVCGHKYSHRYSYLYVIVVGLKRPLLAEYTVKHNIPTELPPFVCVYMFGEELLLCCQRTGQSSVFLYPASLSGMGGSSWILPSITATIE